MEIKLKLNGKNVTASVDADTGANHFLEDSQGLHRYVVKAWKDEAYSQQINALL